MKWPDCLRFASCAHVWCRDSGAWADAPAHRPGFFSGLLGWLGIVMVAVVTSTQAEPAANPTDPILAQALQAAVDLVREGGRLPDRTRLEVVPGSLDPRLRLAPCQKVQPYLPPGAPPWGRSRVGLRCISGPVPWNVYLPVTVKVWAPVLTARHALAAGAVLQADDLLLVEGDLAEQASPSHRELSELLGRQLAQAIPPGTVVRDIHLRTRSWFQSGEQVTIVTTGSGFGASTTGQALSQGIEGQVVRVRTDSGRVILAWPVAENRVELRL